MKNTTEKFDSLLTHVNPRGSTPGVHVGRVWAGRAAVFVISFILTTLVLVMEIRRGVGAHEFHVGTPAPRSLFAPFSLSYINEKAAEELRSQKSLQTPSVYRVEAKSTEESRQKIDTYFKALIAEKQKPAETRQPAHLGLSIPGSSLHWLMNEASLEEVRKHLELVFAQTLEQGILADEKKRELVEVGTQELTLQTADQKSEKIFPLSDIVILAGLREKIEKTLPEGIAKNRNMKNAISEILLAAATANLTAQEEETRSRRKKAAETVEPVQIQVQKDELIVQRGIVVTPEKKVRIDEIQKKLQARRTVNKILAVGLLVLFTYSLCFVYLYTLEKRILRDLRTAILIHSVFLLTVLCAKGVSSNLSFILMPTALAPLLLVLLADVRLGMMGAIAISVLTAPLAQFGVETILASLLSGFAGTFAGIRVRKRLHFLKAGAVVGLATFIVIFSFQIFQENFVWDSFQTAIWGFANGLLVAILSFFLLPFLEAVFNLTTDITLLELSDLNHPLLKRMIVEAPGTYHHSLVVSTLAEAACESIGANALLARVGCYFHDIGKVPRAEFFTENQQDKSFNRHDKLTPTMSSLVIMNHVKDGMELGRQYKIKERILRFIPEHQGTGVIYYFYKKALDSARPGERVNPDDFRYGGPKPQSRETAVAMLADSVEGASRSLKEPTPDSIQLLVRKIINEKFIDGQLDQCPLTLRDLFKIQESFVRNLMAIFHTRVSYPESAWNKAIHGDIFEGHPFPKLPVNFKE